MHALYSHLCRGIVLVLLAGSLGCQSLRYREVQHDFEQAVRAENEGSESPFTDWYQIVLQDLTPDAIGRLDPRLRPNAFLLRAVSAWRTGQFDVARASARAGLNQQELRPHSRDDVILHMIDALVIDSELLERFRRADGAVSETDYAEYARDFKTASGILDQAAARIAGPTPQSVQHYWHFHRWRILQNWSQVISALPPTAVATMRQANADATEFLGQDLSGAAAAERDAIPANHPYHQLIRAREGGR